MAQQQPHWTSKPEIDTNYNNLTNRAQNVTCLATHGTKLLAGSADGRVALYDLEQRSTPASACEGSDRQSKRCGMGGGWGIYILI